MTRPRVCARCTQPLSATNPAVATVPLPGRAAGSYGSVCAACVGTPAPAPAAAPAPPQAATGGLGAAIAAGAAAGNPLAQRLVETLTVRAARARWMRRVAGWKTAPGALPVRCTDCRHGVAPKGHYSDGRRCPAGLMFTNAHWRRCEFFSP